MLSLYVKTCFTGKERPEIMSSYDDTFSPTLVYNKQTKCEGIKGRVKEVNSCYADKIRKLFV